MFKKLEGDTAMLVQGGVYKTTDLYEWAGKLFAKAAGGYIRLRKDGTTSKDGVRLEHMEIETPLFSDKFGRLATVNAGGYTPVAVTPEGRLQVEHHA
jgi:hypothetical protein